MTTSFALVESFLAQAPSALAGLEQSRLEPLLVKALDTARAPWPDLVVPAEAFIRHLAERLPEDRARDEGVESVLSALNLGDLYLACACVTDVPGALAALEREHLANVPDVLRRQRYHPEAVNDIYQKLLEKLFMNKHLATYSGEGKLWSWIEVIAKRTANKMASRVAVEPSNWHRIVDGLPDTADLEKEVLTKDLLAKLQSAMRTAAAALSDEQRELLRLHYVDGVPEAKLARMFSISQPTISRRLARAREIILVETERQLRDQHGLTRGEFESFIEEVRSRLLDLSFSRVLGEPRSPE